MKKPVHDSVASILTGDSGDKKPSVERRRVISIMATGILSPVALTASSAEVKAAPNLLVDAGAEADFKPLRPDDIQMTKPILAFPFDAETGTPKKNHGLTK